MVEPQWETAEADHSVSCHFWRSIDGATAARMRGSGGWPDAEALFININYPTTNFPLARQLEQPGRPYRRAPPQPSRSYEPHQD